MPGSPPTTTRLGLPRYAQTDPAQFSPQVNAIVDTLDPIAARTDDTRFTNARTPTAHATTHQPGGSDTLAVDAASGTGSLRTLGPGANQAAPGNDVRFRGTDFTSISGRQLYDVGVLNQIRAGRELTATDFTSLGLSAPLGLWNLSNLTDASGNGRTLSNKGSVTFAAGINGVASTAAQFTGSTGQALYIADSGAADPLRLKTGSWGCWFRTAKRATTQAMVAKRGTSAQLMFDLSVNTSNVVAPWISLDGTNVLSANGVSDVADDRWHLAIVTHDGTTLRNYVDGVLEGVGTVSGAMFASSAPLNVGGFGADAGAAAGSSHYGRVDEAFVTADILTEDQVRCLYAARLTHTLGVTPTGVRLNVHRRRKGFTLAVADFTTGPLRLHNFTAGSLGDEGTNGLTLANAYTTLIVSVAGADGTYSINADPTLRGNAFSFGGAHQGLSATDAGLPSGTAARSYGCWFKTTTTGPTVMSYGATVAAADVRLWLNGSGQAIAANGADAIIGPYVTDGQWHFFVVSEDNAAGDGVRRKLYVDGRLVGGSTVLNSITLGGANKFRIGANQDGSGPFTGQIDGAFVTGYAMTQPEVLGLYAKGSQDLGASPKEAGAHVERLDASSVLFIGDTLESQHTVDLGVVA